MNVQRLKKLPGFDIYILFSIIILLGLGWPINKLGLEDIPPFWFAALRLVIATVCMFFAILCMKKLIIPRVNDLPLLFSLSFFQIGLFVLFINLGLNIEPSGSSAVLVYTTPIWVTPLAIFIFKEKNSWLKWLGFTLGILGIALMLNPKEINWSNVNVIYSTFFLLGASFAFSISILCAKYMKWYHTPLELIPWQLLIACIFLVTMAFLLSPHPKILLNIQSVFCLLYTGIFPTALGFLGMSKVSKELPATLTSIGFLGVPVSGMLFSMLMMHEPIDIYITLAMVLIIMGVICVVFGDAKKSH